VIPGRQKFHGAAFDSFGDHRVAMAFAVAGLAAEGNTVISDANCAGVSFPAFFSELNRLAER
jgi:3-phosphoshikimate 1-carboxyvinyltransferase